MRKIFPLYKKYFTGVFQIFSLCKKSVQMLKFYSQYPTPESHDSQ